MVDFIVGDFTPRHPRDTYRRARWFTNRLNRLYDLECALYRQANRRESARQGRLIRRAAARAE